MYTLMSAPPAPRHGADSPKRQSIVDAARELFVSQGYGAVSMEAIARAAGVSKATLYAHFASKDQLFASIINEACQSNVMVRDLLPGPEDGLRQGLVLIAQRMLGFFLEERTLAIHRVVIAESLRFPELGQAFYDNGPAVFLREFGAWLTEQAQAGRMVVPDPESAAGQFVGLLRTGLFLRALLGLEPRPDTAMVASTAEAAVDTFLKAFAPGV